MMKVKSLLLVTAAAALITAQNSCAEKALNTVKNENSHEYINSSEKIKQSKDKLEEAPAYEVYFTLDRTVECISVSLETASLPVKFTEESNPIKSFFIVEKIMEIKSGSNKGRTAYIQTGRNYNSRWEVHNPVKICGNTTDPVSRLGGSVFRIRFTTFDTKPVYFTVTVYTETGVKFSPDPAMLTGEGVPVK